MNRRKILGSVLSLPVIATAPSVSTADADEVPIQRMSLTEAEVKMLKDQWNKAYCGGKAAATVGILEWGKWKQL